MEHIIYEDKNIIVYNKPAGMLVQSEQSFDLDAVSSVKTYLAGKGEKSEVSVINRLDRPVSGLVLMAKNKTSAGRLSKELTTGKINKEYLAVILGKLSDAKGTMTDYLLKDARTNTSSMVSSSIKGAKRAELEYQVIASKIIRYIDSDIEASLVKIHLITGRHHQIRVQFAGRGVPLLGDTKYNMLMKRQKGWQNIALCSYRLDFLDKSFQIKPEGQGFEYFSEELETI